MKKFPNHNECVSSRLSKCLSLQPLSPFLCEVVWCERSSQVWVDPAVTAESLIAEDVKADICMGRGRRFREGSGRQGERCRSVLFYNLLVWKKQRTRAKKTKGCQRERRANITHKLCKLSTESRFTLWQLTLIMATHRWQWTIKEHEHNTTTSKQTKMSAAESTP